MRYFVNRHITPLGTHTSGWEGRSPQRRWQAGCWDLCCPCPRSSGGLQGRRKRRSGSGPAATRSWNASASRHSWALVRTIQNEAINQFKPDKLLLLNSPRQSSSKRKLAEVFGRTWTLCLQGVCGSLVADSSWCLSAGRTNLWSVQNIPDVNKLKTCDKSTELFGRRKRRDPAVCLTSPWWFTICVFYLIKRITLTRIPDIND